jgi:hypothetical protein
VTAEQAEQVARLARCVMLPGSAEKRLVKQLLAHRPTDRPLSAAQAAWLDQIFVRYREQMARMGCGPMPRYVTVGELLDRGELAIGETVEVGDVTVCRYRSQYDHISGKYYAGRGGRYLWRGGTWHSGTGSNPHWDDPPGYFDDLPTLLDHLFVALHGGPEPAAAGG